MVSIPTLRRTYIPNYLKDLGRKNQSGYGEASTQAKGAKYTSFLTRKEQSGLSTLGLRR